MTKTLSPRLGITRWSAPTDLQGRTDFDNDNGRLEDLAAIDLVGDLRMNRPAPAARGRYWQATDTRVTYRDDGAAWVPVAGGLEDARASPSAECAPFRRMPVAAQQSASRRRSSCGRWSRLWSNVQAAGRCGSAQPALAYSARRNARSKRTLCPATAAPASRALISGSTWAKRGARATSRSRMPWMWVTQVRQRVVRDHKSRRGRGIDPAWTNRRLLLRAGNTLSPRALARLTATLRADDPTDAAGFLLAATL